MQKTYNLALQAKTTGFVLLKFCPQGAKKKNGFCLSAKAGNTTEGGRVVLPCRAKTSYFSATQGNISCFQR